MTDARIHEETSAGYKGARWVRADLHLHSPHSRHFRYPPGLDRSHRDEIIGLYVERLARQGIEVAAITDYNMVRVEWFEALRDAAAARDIALFPGVELSLSGVGKHGLHILAIFPQDADLEGINRSILSLDRDPSEPLVDEEGRHRDIRLKSPPESAIRELKERGALIVVPHPSDKNGLFKTLKPADAARFIDDVRPDAIEDFTGQDLHRLACTDILGKEQLKRIASVAFSDAHALEEIGTKSYPDGRPRATYLKLSVTDDLEALRLALHDPEVRVRVGEKIVYSYSRLLSLEVEGSGFLGGLRLAFSPELNVLIGGRGVGKSAILEVIRYVLGLEPYAPAESREGLVRYALGSGGRAHLYLERVVAPDVRRTYRLERVWGEEPRVFEVDGTEKEVPLSPLDVLDDPEVPLFFGQKEIYEVSRNEDLRLRLLDEIIGRRATTKHQELLKLERQVHDNARRLLELREKLRDREEIAQRLKEIDHEIQLYRQYGLAEKLAQATALAADEQRLYHAKEHLEEALQDWKQTAEDLAERWQSALDGLSQGRSASKELLVEAKEAFETLRGSFKAIFDEGQKALKDGLDRLEDIMERWREKRRPLDEEIRRIKRELGPQSLDPDQLVRLTEERTQLSSQLRVLEAIQKHEEKLLEERRSLLGRLRDIRYEVFRLRQEQAEEISARLRGRVRVKVGYKEGKEAFARRLAGLLQGSGVDRRSIERLCGVGSEEVVDGETIAKTVREGPSALKDRFDLTDGRAQQIYSWLTQDERILLDLEPLAPDDVVHVYLRSNEREEPLEDLSPGQKATAMLLLILTQEERPLIVDQPEDDLDNRFIYEDIVRLLREQKGRRQILAATHNPNIPVLGDAELTVALEASEDRARIVVQGSVDRAEVREAVKRIMEGGEEAFRRRAEKYGWTRR